MKMQQETIKKVAQFIGILFILLFMFMGGLFLGLTKNGSFSFKQFVEDKLELAHYNIIEKKGIDDNITKKVAEFCGPFNRTTQVICVISQIDYKVNKHNDSTTRTPDETYEKGGVCRDYALLYNSIFKRLGWETKYHFDMKDHVFIIITQEEIYCTIDQKDFQCNDFLKNEFIGNGEKY